MATMAQRISDLAGAVRDKFNTLTPKLIPTGGTTGQVLAKKSGTDNDVEWLSTGTSSTNIITTSITFVNEENYVEATVNDVSILSTSKLVCSFVGDEEIAIQAITCGIKSVIDGSCVIFAGTPYGATGTYAVNIIVG